jgi:hypothetical protein
LFVGWEEDTDAMFFCGPRVEADECTTDQVVLFSTGLLAYGLAASIASVLLVANLTPGRTVLDASALVATFSGLLDALRANSAVLVYGEDRFVGFTDNSVRGAKTAVNNKYFSTGQGETRTSRHFCTCRCSTSQSCTRHIGGMLAHFAGHDSCSACTCLSLWSPPCWLR